MEYKNNATSDSNYGDTDIVMSRSGRLEERPTVDDRKIEWQHMKGHVNQVQHHLHAAIEPLLSRIQMLEDTVAEQAKLLEKKVSDLSAPTLDSKLEDIAKHWVDVAFSKYDVTDFDDFEGCVVDIIDDYDFGDIMSDAISDALPTTYIHDVVQGFINNKVRVVCDD